MNSWISAVVPRVSFVCWRLLQGRNIIKLKVKHNKSGKIDMLLVDTQLVAVWGHAVQRGNQDNLLLVFCARLWTHCSCWMSSSSWLRYFSRSSSTRRRCLWSGSSCVRMASSIMRPSSDSVCLSRARTESWFSSWDTESQSHFHMTCDSHKDALYGAPVQKSGAQPLTPWWTNDKMAKIAVFQTQWNF